MCFLSIFECLRRIQHRFLRRILARIAFLALRPGKVVPPSELLEHLYGDEDSREANALEALVARLRRKAGPGVIGTRRGFGYFLEDGSE